MKTYQSGVGKIAGFLLTIGRLANFWGLSVMHTANSKVLGLAFGAGLAIAASTIGASATTVLTDGNFTDVTVLSGYSSDPSGLTTVSDSVCSNCGDPGAALQTIFNATTSTANGAFTAYGGYVDNLLSYDPATQGAIASITFSEDHDITVVGGPTVTSSSHSDPLIEQDGNYYVARIATGTVHFPGTTGFLSSTVSGLTTSDFVLFDLATGSIKTGNPNFSSTGDPILFGDLPLSGAVYAGQYSTRIADNLSFAISQTPLPAALPLFATGLGALGLLGWRRKRKAQAAA